MFRTPITPQDDMEATPEAGPSVAVRAAKDIAFGSVSTSLPFRDTPPVLMSVCSLR